MFSAILHEIYVVNVTLLVDEKNRKTEYVYLCGWWKDDDEEEVTKRLVIRNHIFKHVKFIKREGTRVVTGMRKRKTTKKIVYDKCHERVDLTK